jgi:hypothetical protein
MADWTERIQRQHQPAQRETTDQDLDDLTTSFLATIDELKDEVNQIKDANGTLFTALQNMLGELVTKNTEALIQANNQFMHLVIRKIDELEDRISSDEPSYTNVLYSDPELFDEISARGEAQVAAQEMLIEQVENETEEDEVPEEVALAYHQWKSKEIKWTDFVRACGGVKEAGYFKRILSSSS